MNRTAIVSVVLLVGLALGVCGPAWGADKDIVIADFEGKTYPEGWKVEGTAFGKAPASGKFGNQQAVSGFEGKGLVNTFIKRDTPTGKLTSTEFTIERDYIKFLIGGGHHPGKTCMNLLIDGKIVHTATGPNVDDGGNEFLNWENWDVKKYKGKIASVQIVDDVTDGWGHVNVDQIIQSNTQTKKKKFVAPKRRPRTPPTPANSREIKITGKYIIFPVANKGGKRGRMMIKVGDTLVHHLDCDFPTSKDNISWWTYLDMSEYKGKTATVSANALPEICEMFESSDKIRNLQPLYDEALRPQFHISQKRGWNNDPNGMFYHDGRYHFFWQCNPAGRNWANMYWGYATSTDMVHWTEHDRALRSYGGNEKNRHPKMAVRNCFSGSANVDKNNSGGWQKGAEKTLVLAFTDTGCGESLAYSTDAGKTWKYYEGNPVITHRGRDPKLMWYEPGKHWVIAVYDEDKDKKIGRNIALYASKDLKKWELTGKIPGYFECAEIFELPVDGDKKNTKWVIFAANAQYAIGKFNGKTFVPEHKGKHKVHYGNYYASQCFSNSPDGRVVQVGWARFNIPDMPFNQTFTVPTNLTLHATKDGTRMYVTPIKELEKLRKPKPQAVENKVISDTITFETKDQHFDIVVTLKQGTAKKAILKFGANTTTYDFAAQKLDEMPLAMKDGKVTIRVLVDRPIVELIGGGGACFKTMPRRDMGKPLGKISLTADGGAMTVESFVAYEMKSTWKKK
ncbi:MAG: glycoside hydrolase family 32 protein [Phycisphaerales bacterium]|jgi:fructan beta-fructosidase|nr:glycoside hydrolase family 32 protein [Phycisphaerales bacterium]